jgi:hypothetical protein
MNAARKSPMVTRQTKVLYRRFIQGSVQFGTFWLTLSESCVFHDARSEIVSGPAWIKQTAALFHCRLPAGVRSGRHPGRYPVSEFIHATLPLLTPLLTRAVALCSRSEPA